MSRNLSFFLDWNAVFQSILQQASEFHWSMSVSLLLSLILLIWVSLLPILVSLIKALWTLLVFPKNHPWTIPTSALTFLYLAICCFGGLDSSYYSRLWGASLGYLKYPLVFHISTINFSLRNALDVPHSSSKLCLHFIFFKKI